DCPAPAVRAPGAVCSRTQLSLRMRARSEGVWWRAPPGVLRAGRLPVGRPGDGRGLPTVRAWVAWQEPDVRNRRGQEGAGVRVATRRHRVVALALPRPQGGVEA